ncbi:ankyrin repeat domain-containing protein, partial [Endozoicomonas sp.]|uniref:ankyrin repeat domain-containing protein n=1 Tax=Endozoicomonas sp. TaxID=1892382 RepID=UPI00383B9196
MESVCASTKGSGNQTALPGGTKTPLKYRNKYRKPPITEGFSSGSQAALHKRKTEFMQVRPHLQGDNPTTDEATREFVGSDKSLGQIEEEQPLDPGQQEQYDTAVSEAASKKSHARGCFSSCFSRSSTGGNPATGEPATVSDQSVRREPSSDPMEMQPLNTSEAQGDTAIIEPDAITRSRESVHSEKLSSQTDVQPLSPGSREQVDIAGYEATSQKLHTRGCFKLLSCFGRPATGGNPTTDDAAVGSRESVRLEKSSGQIEEGQSLGPGSREQDDIVVPEALSQKSHGGGCIISCFSRSAKGEKPVTDELTTVSNQSVSLDQASGSMEMQPLNTLQQAQGDTARCDPAVSSAPPVTNKKVPMHPLLEACKQGNIGYIQRVIDENKVLIGQRLQWGKLQESSLDIACYYGQTEVVKILLEKGDGVKPKPGGQSDSAFTALHAASRGENADKQLFSLLLEHGALVDAKTVKGETPLMLTLRKSNQQIIKPCVEKLLAHNANVHAK